MMKFERHNARRGSALLLAIVATIVLAGLAGAVMAVSGAFKEENGVATEASRALYVAEAGLSEGIASVVAGAPANFGTPNPVPFGNGVYWGTVVDNGDNTTTVTSFATVSGRTRGLEAVLSNASENIYTSALFAGNSSGDPLYDMKFGGKGVQADDINGNIYSGGNVTVKDDATINGGVKASGSISGVSGTSGSIPPPDLAKMDYENIADYDVAGLFSGATYKSNSLGGSAWQVQESNPAHIFRMNPSDRATETKGTAKNDYFLEDPYESVSTSSKVAASAGTHITLSGQDSNPGANGSDKIYYIDGNLWIHNKQIYSFTMFNSGPDAVKVTFVVKGNIYFSDNILYQDPKEDGVAFIAMKDPAVQDSGNVYFGDPVYGTLEQMDAFMYAENNFYDNNLSASGSAKVTVNGNMTAGNQVLINRDFGNEHSKLTVNFDDRIATGAITLPGLPGINGPGTSWAVKSWREVAAP